MQLQHQQEQQIERQSEEKEEEEEEDSKSLLPLHQTVFDLLSPVLFLVERFHGAASDETSIVWSTFEIRMASWLLHFFGIDGEWMKLLRSLFSSVQKEVNRNSLLSLALGIGKEELSKEVSDVGNRMADWLIE